MALSNFPDRVLIDIFIFLLTFCLFDWGHDVIEEFKHKFNFLKH